MSGKCFPGDGLNFEDFSQPGGLPRSILDPLSEADKLRAIVDEQSELPRGLADEMSRIEKESAAFPGGIFERLGGAGPHGSSGRLFEINAARSAIEEITGPGSPLHDIQQQIDEQQEALTAFRVPEHESLADRFLNEPVHPLQFEIPDNPLHETNDRLANIEVQFERAQEIATRAAGIATDLQQAALNFLGKFEAAARDNDRAAKRAIWLGVMAVIIAVAMPAFQIVYTEFWRAPADAAASQSALGELKAEVEALRAGQEAMAERIAEALERREGNTAVVLKDIRDLLAKSARDVAAP